MATCMNGHRNAEGQRFCGECGVPLVTSTARRLRRGERVKIIAPGDDHFGEIGKIFELFDDGSVCVKFSGDSEPYAFGRGELQVLPAASTAPTRIAESHPLRTNTPTPVRPAPPSAPGWYPDSLNPGKQASWDGTGWGEPVGGRTDAGISRNTAVAIGVCVLLVIGFAMSMQTVSLFTGSGPVWTGVAVVGAGTALAFFLRAATWVRVLAAVMLALALANALYIEDQMSKKRDEITQIFNN